MARKRSLSSRISSLIVAELLIGVSLSVVSLLVFLKIAGSIQSIQRVDTLLSMWVFQLRQPLLTEMMFFITALGNELLLVFLVLVLIVSVVRRHKREAGMIVLIFGIGVILNLVLKEMIARERPIISPLIAERLYSFPSGHAMNAFVFYSTLTLYVYRVSRNWTYTLISAGVNGTIILLIGVSRIYLGVHYVSDVIAGFIAGFWWIVTALVIGKSHTVISKYRKSAT